MRKNSETQWGLAPDWPRAGLQQAVPCRERAWGVARGAQAGWGLTSDGQGILENGQTRPRVANVSACCGWGGGDSAVTWKH